MFNLKSISYLGFAFDCVVNNLLGSNFNSRIVFNSLKGTRKAAYRKLNLKDWASWVIKSFVSRFSLDHLHSWVLIESSFDTEWIHPFLLSNQSEFHYESYLIEFCSVFLCFWSPNKRVVIFKKNQIRWLRSHSSFESLVQMI